MSANDVRKFAHVRKFLMVLEVIMLLSLLFGCKKNALPASSDAEKFVKKHLNSKYEQSFEILMIEKKNIGIHTAQYIYSGTACVAGQSEITFEFTVNDEKTIKDNYPKVLFAEMAEQEIKDLLSRHEVFCSNICLEYVQKCEAYLDYEDYIANQNVIIDCDVDSDIGGDMMQGEKIYAFASEAKEKGFSFYIGVNIFGNMRYLMHVDNISLLSEEEWKNWIRAK